MKVIVFVEETRPRPGISEKSASVTSEDDIPSDPNDVAKTAG